MVCFVFCPLLFFFSLFFYWRTIDLQNSVVYIKPQHESAIGIHTSPPFWTSLPSPFPSHLSRLIQSPCLSFLSHTANSCWLSILHMVMKVSLLLFPNIFLSFTFWWFSFKTTFLVFATNMERWLSPFAFVMQSCDFFSSLFFPTVCDTGSYRSSIKYGSFSVSQQPKNSYFDFQFYDYFSVIELWLLLERSIGYPVWHVSQIYSLFTVSTNSKLFFVKMAPHSSTLAWKILWTEEPGRLQSMGLRRVVHDWVTSLSLFTFMHWRRKWQPTPVFLPGESQGLRSLVGCRLWGRTESDMTEVT